MNNDPLQSELLKTIRTVPNWPKSGVHFRDITTVFQSPVTWAKVIEHFAERYRDQKLDAIAGLEARGFIFGATLAHALNLSFIPIRKKGKLLIRRCLKTMNWSTAPQPSKSTLMPVPRETKSCWQMT